MVKRRPASATAIIEDHAAGRNKPAYDPQLSLTDKGHHRVIIAGSASVEVIPELLKTVGEAFLDHGSIVPAPGIGLIALLKSASK
jgi:hypothetical protein